MGNIIKFHSSYSFCADVLKIKDENGNVKQKVYIGIKDKESKKVIINPVTSLLRTWSSKKLYTQLQYAQKVTNFLNYVYFDSKSVKRFDEINVNHVVEFINMLTAEGQARSYVLEHKRLLTTFFYYAVSHYDNICAISKENFKINNKNMVVWPKLDVQILLPSVAAGHDRKRNKITNLDLPLVFRFIELAMYETPNCAFGFYFLFFGGLRASEVCHLMDRDLPSKISNKAYFSINVEDKIIDEDLKYADISENKKNRKQMVLYIKDLYEELFVLWKLQCHSGPIVQKKSGGGMTERGFAKNFRKVKNILIKKLEESTYEEDRLLAINLSSYDWGTHIGRGVFSNIIADNTKNPYLISVARGDSSFSSALPYISESEETLQNTTKIINNMYASFRKDKNAKRPNTKYLNYYPKECCLREAARILKDILRDCGLDAEIEYSETINVTEYYEDAIKIQENKYKSILIDYMQSSDEVFYPPEIIEDIYIKNWFEMHENHYLIKYSYNDNDTFVLNDTFRLSDWGYYFSACGKWLSVHKGESIPFSAKVGNVSLGNWITEQRTEFRKGYLTKEREILLQTLGLSFNIYDESWKYKFGLLCEYKNEFGNTNIEKRAKYKNEPLGFWCAAQRQDKKDGKLSADREQCLLDIGFDFDPHETEWNRRFEQYKRYVEQAGDCYISRRTDFEGEHLGAWVETQRKRHQDGKMSVERAGKLLSLNPNIFKDSV